MQCARFCLAMAGVAALCACGGTLASVRLQPMIVRNTLHVGEIGAVQLPSERRYTVGGGDSVVFMRRKEQHGTTTYFFRAVKVGYATLIATPRDLGPDNCISCVTEHNFIEVIQ